MGGPGQPARLPAAFRGLPLPSTLLLSRVNIVTGSATWTVGLAGCRQRCRLRRRNWSADSETRGRLRLVPGAPATWGPGRGERAARGTRCLPAPCYWPDCGGPLAPSAGSAGQDVPRAEAHSPLHLGRGGEAAQRAARSRPHVAVPRGATHAPCQRGGGAQTVGAMGRGRVSRPRWPVREQERWPDPSPSEPKSQVDGISLLGGRCRGQRSHGVPEPGDTLAVSRSTARAAHGRLCARSWERNLLVEVSQTHPTADGTPFGKQLFASGILWSAV